jgi:hypothetical protein
MHRGLIDRIVAADTALALCSGFLSGLRPGSWARALVGVVDILRVFDMIARYFRRPRLCSRTGGGRERIDGKARQSDPADRCDAEKLGAKFPQATTSLQVRVPSRAGS